MTALTAERRHRFAWLGLVMVALALRFWELGLRTMSHDESLHAFYSFRLATEGAYQHDPAYHGPLLYHLNALVFFLVGASDVTARMVPSLAGAALVAGLWWWRRYLGAAGAWLAAACITFSPSLLFYSRHIRNDIYIAALTLVWAYAVLRYLEEPHPRWRALLMSVMALSFACKEVSFITGAVIGSFVVLLVLGGRRRTPARAEAALDLAVLMLTLVLPFAAGALFPLFGWPPVGEATRQALTGAGGLVVAGLFVVAGVAGAARFGLRPWLKLAGGFWAVQVALFTTFFTNLSGGLASGIVGSLGYWLTQQEVARAGQPWFYYGLIGLLYEPVTLLVGVAAVGAGLWRLARSRRVAAEEETAPGRDRESLWLPFLAWWILASWLGYAVAGEKMPWLLVHQVLPLCLSAGWGLSRLLGGNWAGGDGRHRLLLIGVTAGAAVVAAGLLRAEPFAGRTLEAATATTAWWALAVWLAVLAGVAVLAAMRLGRTAAFRMTVVGLLVPLAVLSLRASLQLNFVNFDLATEPLSYAQATPDVPRVMREIARLDDRRGGHRQVQVAVDDESSWPFSWYLRDYPRTVAWGETPALAADAEVILVGPKNHTALAPQVARGYVRERGLLYWWPLQDYAALSASSLAALLADPARREALWQIVMHRRYGVPPAEWPARREFDLYMRSDAAALIGLHEAASPDVVRPPGATAATSWIPRTIVSGPFDGLALLRPTAIAVTADGARVVADSGHDRIVVIDPDGRLRLTIGRGRCLLTEPGRPGCIDPDGSGPAAAGDGQFHEPWGVAVAPSGEIVVADTWNGRIQVFTADGVFLRAFGRFGRVVPGADEADEPWLFGPRGLAVTADGELVVADTGNRRLLVVSLTGERRRVAGPDIGWPPALNEPTGVTWDPGGSLLVADLWNQRVLRLDRFARPLAAWRVPGWESRDAAHKAALAVDAAGRVYAVEPASGRIYVFSSAGILEAVRAPATGDAFTPTGGAFTPTGIATVGNSVLVVDREGGRLLDLPMPEPPP